jgi:hypothetical protein
MMQYALLIYEAPAAYEPLGDEQRRALTEEYMALRDDPGMLGGAKLQPVETATTIRVQDGATLVSDGPFADTKEVFGGYFLYEADDVAAAIEIASRIPAARLGGSVEVRPIVEQRR